MNPIYKLAEQCDQLGIPYTLNPLWGGMQIRFPWNHGDLICHSGSYGNEKGMVESMGCPWDDEDVSCLTVEDAVEKLADWYTEVTT